MEFVNGINTRCVVDGLPEPLARCAQMPDPRMRSSTFQLCTSSAPRRMTNGNIA